MIVDIKVGKIIITTREIVIRVLQGNAMTLQADQESIELYGDSCVIVANAGTLKWTFKLDSYELVELISNELGVEIY